jgi:hypothetical protein
MITLKCIRKAGAGGTFIIEQEKKNKKDKS